MNLDQSLSATVDIRHISIDFGFLLGAQNPCSFCSPGNEEGPWSQASGDHYGH